ncbi:hypothetical protein Patl1_04653 [Pistacia atlantica]|uniref:Uncharacterized protein n=1 Tax=Pistacia atlantica TaxID=434234 RepID=A0ACC1BR60_9ROSI|nr:hypothetical protein Patl1_04653 [Pistacia atlantica]
MLPQLQELSLLDYQTSPISTQWVITSYFRLLNICVFRIVPRSLHDFPTHKMINPCMPKQRYL